MPLLPFISFHFCILFHTSTTTLCLMPSAGRTYPHHYYHGRAWTDGIRTLQRRLHTLALTSRVGGRHSGLYRGDVEPGQASSPSLKGCDYLGQPLHISGACLDMKNNLDLGLGPSLISIYLSLYLAFHPLPI